MAVELREWEKNEMARRDALRERNRQVRMERLKDEIADGSARHGVYAIKDDIKNLEYLMGGGISGQRAFEMDQLRQQGQNAIGAEWAKAAGLANQGMEAARIKGAADVQTAQIGADAAQRQAEIEWSKKQQIAGMQFGMIGSDGNLIPGSNERTAGVQGEWEVKKQQEANKGLFARAEIDRQKQERDIEGKLQDTLLKKGAKLQGDKIKAYAGIISRAISGGSLIGEDTATSLAKLAQANQNNPELLEAITAISGNGQQPNNASAQPPAKKIPGYSQAKIEELQKRGYTWQNGNWVRAK